MDDALGLSGDANRILSEQEGPSLEARLLSHKEEWLEGRLELANGLRRLCHS
jgi:hypothetical protein